FLFALLLCYVNWQIERAKPEHKDRFWNSPGGVALAWIGLMMLAITGCFAML
ncbi:unnamed protein product, partial [marine sediment metagenome]